ncbi:MAG: hypothetical protein Q8O67_14335 [Deltaproteobacteria bacterium]|nr:hypothetical protein [Deltaproteobacteria bacterium]
MSDDVTGRFELHVFALPLDPPPEVIEVFRAACAGAPTPMKALLLQLDYVDKGFVGVLQSSRYVEGDLAAAVEAVRVDAAVLRAAGLTVIREKVEATATNTGVPHSAQEASPTSSTRYFEFHVLIDGKDRPLDDDDMGSLRALSQSFSLKLARPVPLSFNALKPSQRFLNLRAVGIGLEEALVVVDELRAAVEGPGLLQVKKVIAEYICADTNRAVDNGWLEPL